MPEMHRCIKLNLIESLPAAGFFAANGILAHLISSCNIPAGWVA